MNLPYPKTDVKYMIYGINSCPYCRRAKDALKNSRYAKKSMYLDITPYKEYVLQHFRANGLIPGDYRMVPVVFRKGKFIGGCTEFLAAIGSR